MKLSNKLLIGLATILLVVPICVFYIVVKANRTDAHTYTDLLYKEATSLQVPDKYMRTVSVQPFKNVRLVGSRKTTVNLQLVKSDKFAIKADKDKESDFVYHIDDQGNLEIDFQNRKQYSQLSISIFSPQLGDLSVSDVHLQSITAQTDHLHINLERQQALYFGAKTQINSLSLAVKHSGIDIGWADSETLNAIQELTLDLDSSAVRFKKQALQKVTLKLIDSEAAFGLENDSLDRIDELRIYTEGKSAVYIKNTTVAQLSGSLSDQTITDLPVYHLRKLLNSK